MSAEAAARPATEPSQLRAAALIARYALRESVRRRVFPVVIALTTAFVVLYGIGASFAFDEVGDAGAGASFTEIDDRALAGATLLGLAMFATLFLGAVLATFLTLGVVRGDAEAGLLQPLVARPVSRQTILLARFAGAAAVAAGYVVVVFVACLLLTSAIGDWSPDRPLQAALLLAGSVVLITCLSVLVAVFAGSTAQGIAVLMLFGAGLTAGLLGQIGDALESSTLEQISEVASWVLPFEAVYQDALYSMTAETSGVTGFLLSLGPFGGARDAGIGLYAYSLAYAALTLGLAGRFFAHRDL